MTIFLFGSNGMLGNYVNSVLSERYNIINITRNKIDIYEDWKDLEEKIKKLDIKEDDYIINCIGKIPQKSTSDEIKEYIIINTLFPKLLEKISLETDCKFIHITTDCVYSGFKGNYNETDEHDSKTIYGITKSLGETIKACIIRTSIIGEEKYSKKSLLEWVKSNKNNVINGYDNHIWNGVTCLTLAKIIKNIINNNSTWIGVKHFYSNSVSKYELCSLINKIYNLNIQINKISDPNGGKNMTLTSLNNNFILNDLEKQIIEMKEYDILNKV